MKKVIFILLFSLVAFSCKKNKSSINISTISETNWNLYYKTNVTFNFYARTKVYFKQDNSCLNYRLTDTLSGSWVQNTSTISFNFNDGSSFKGSMITSDSIAGTLITAGNNGIWYAKKI